MIPVLVGTLLLVLAADARAQAPQAAPPAVDAFVRNLTRAEVWRYYEPPPASVADPQTVHIGNRLLAGVRLRRGVLDATVALQYVHLGGLPTDAVGPGHLGTGALYFDHAGSDSSAQVYLRSANLALRGLGGAVDVQVGRMGYTSGAERVSGVPTIETVKRMRLDSRMIGEFEWSLFQRAYDGVRVDWRAGPVTLTGTAFRPTQGGFEDAAGVGISDIDVFAGVATFAPGVVPRSELQVFAYRYDDDRPVTARPDNTGTTATRADVAVTTVGGHLVGAVPAGPGELDLLLWTAVQTGDWYTQDHRAGGFSVEGGYQWPAAPWAPWLRGGLLYTSGDGDPADDRHGTFFPMLPTVRRYSQTTLYSLANLQDAFVQVVVRPSASVTGRVDLHAVSLASSADRWYAGSGATQEEGRIFGYTVRPSGGERRLAEVLEGSLEWRIRPEWSVNGFVGVASRGPVARASFADGPAVFFYIENVLTLF